MSEPDPSVPASGYLLDNRADEAGARFDSLAALFNPVTFGHLERLGIGAGWKCWEVGTGGPSVPHWLSERVGPTGRVLATDIDIHWANEVVSDIIEVRHHDVVEDPPPWSDFDLVHARLVLIHLPERERALAQMAEALKPGGWLLIEDFDSAMQPLACVDPQDAGHELANKVRAGFRALLAERGVDLEYARRLPRMLRSAGLVEVAADAYFAVALPAAIELEKANVNQVRDGLVARGHASAAEIDEYLAALDAGTLDMATAPLISAWGRRR
jgi:ubiquinone/menaquinone biosynthesis C-methylase UbiE